MRSPWSLAAIVALVLSSLVYAEGEPRLSSEEAKEGFQLLFNGKDLTGWREVQGKAGAFRVENGILLGKRGGLLAYWLSTERKYSDFELRLQYMLEPGGNSGIFIRVPQYMGRTSKVGMEIQLQDDTNRTGPPTENDTGSIYRVAAASRFVSRAPGEWNDLAIRCEGDSVRVTLNGELINDFKMSQNPSTAKRPREGYIGLSAHTNTVRFQNVRLKELSAP